MSITGRLLLTAGAGIMALAGFLKIYGTLSLEQFAVLLSVGFMILMHPLGRRRRALIAVDEFVRRSNQSGMAASWRATQLLVVALLFASVLRWIDLSAVWALIVVSVFMTLTYILFMIPPFSKGDVE